MPRTISDQEYEFLQQKRVTADFVEGIYNDPVLNKEAKALIKKKHPNLQIPDYDIEQKVEARFAAERKERDDARKAAEDKAADERWRGERAKVQKEYGFTDDAMKDLEGWMQDKGVGDYEVAASYRAARTPKPIEAEWDESRWHHERAPGFAEIAKDPEAWGRTELLSAIRRGQERQRAG